MPNGRKPSLERQPSSMKVLRKKTRHGWCWVLAQKPRLPKGIRQEKRPMKRRRVNYSYKTRSSPLLTNYAGGVVDPKGQELAWESDRIHKKECAWSCTLSAQDWARMPQFLQDAMWAEATTYGWSSQLMWETLGKDIWSEILTMVLRSNASLRSHLRAKMVLNKVCMQWKQITDGIQYQAQPEPEVTSTQSL